MEKPAQNIQDSFLNNARKDKIVLTIYLMSGVKLSGRIKSFDKYSLVLETNNQEQLIFKHAISTVVTQKTSHSYVQQSSAAAQTAHSAVDSGRAGARGLGGIGDGHPELRSASGRFWSGWIGRRAARRGARARSASRNRWKNWRNLPRSAGAEVVRARHAGAAPRRRRPPHRPGQGGGTGGRREVDAAPTSSSSITT